MTANPLRLLWGVYAWLLVVLMLLIAALPVLALPRLAQRRSAAAFICRAYFLLCGLPVHRIGMDRLPTGACIVVANHASYLDGPLLFAVLPPRFGFVIKKEASRIPLAGTLMRRLGHHFVNRSNRNEGAGDARRILRAVSQGESVAFFPEGTFGVQTGVARFHTGAFATAARAGLPVVPVAIRGTRRALRARTFVPRWSRIEVEALAPITGAPGEGAIAMRDSAREQIAAALSEPLL
ncbi:MAG: 1-acyl-sn-glycerol-3-phosphate acyltransferase [Gammaproteobacteria bacterium]|nr:1-acyl-sn-glycerol-3-phosphate acyltransferase [Gammaproteobacteria bacterium]